MAAALGALHCSAGFRDFVDGLGCPERVNVTLSASNSGVTPYAASNTVMQHAAPEHATEHENGAVDFIMGTKETRVALAVNNAATALATTTVSYWVTADTMSDRKSWPFFFRTVGSDSDLGRVVAALASRLGLAHLGLLSADDEGGHGLRLSLASALDVAGVRLRSESYSVQSEAKMNTTLGDGLDAVVETAKVLVVFVAVGPPGLRLLVDHLVRRRRLASAGSDSPYAPGGGLCFIFNSMVKQDDLESVAAQGPEEMRALQGHRWLYHRSVAGAVESDRMRRFRDYWRGLAHNATALAAINSLMPGGARWIDPVIDITGRDDRKLQLEPDFFNRSAAQLLRRLRLRRQRVGVHGAVLHLSSRQR